MEKILGKYQESPEKYMEGKKKGSGKWNYHFFVTKKYKENTGRVPKKTEKYLEQTKKKIREIELSLYVAKNP